MRHGATCLDRIRRFSFLLPSIFWVANLPYPLAIAAWIVGAGLLWFWVARSIKAWRERREVLLPRWRYLRCLMDVALIAMGLLFGLAGIYDVREFAKAAPNIFRPGWGGCYGPLWSTVVLPYLTAACFHIGWAAALVLLFGRDLRRSLRS